MTVRALSFSVLAFVAISVPLTLVAGEWYAAPPPLGADLHPGTQQEPFATIQKGIDAASWGDTVIAAQGTYIENIHFNGKNITLRSSNPANWAVVRNTVIDGNEAGAVVTFAGTEDASCLLRGFTIQNGKGIDGGGICGGIAADHSNATIRNNVVTGNSAQNGGGLAYCDGVIRNNFIYGNSAATNGGGVYECDGVIESNVIAGNSAGWVGGGLAGCAGVIRNDTICQNSSAQYGGGVGGCQAAIVNCILWGNTAHGSPQQNQDCYNVSYCCVQGGGGGTGGIADDPHFMDANGPDDDPNTYEDNDYRLWVGSLCIDSGTNQEWMTGAVDLDGSPRVLQGRVSLTVDMGAYEHVSSGPTSQPWYVDDSVSASGDGKSWGTAFKTIQEGIDSASDGGDTVTVGEGIYLENVNLNGKNVVRGVVTGQSLTVMLDRHFPMNEEPKAPCGRP